MSTKQRLAAAIAELPDSLTIEEAVERLYHAFKQKQALSQKDRAGLDRTTRLRRFLTQEVWPLVPPNELGRSLTRQEEEHILDYGEHGV
jgi:antitoxin VapB